MKIIIALLSLVIILSGICRAQSGWFSVYSCDSIGLRSVYFTDSNTGYSVGIRWMPDSTNGCVVLKTTNAGSSWFEQITPLIDSTSYWFSSVFFTDINTGYLSSWHSVMNIGRFLKTTNGGNSWYILPFPQDRIGCIHFINSSTGFISGLQCIYKTTNAGENWTGQMFYYNILSAIDFIDNNTGFTVSSHGEIFKTTNCGETWIRKDSCGIPLRGIDFCNSNTGIIAGGFENNSQNIILRTTNTGENWTVVSYTSSTCYLTSMKFVNSSTGWITGFCGLIIKTTNAGLSWFRQSTTNNDFRAEYFLDVNTGFAVAAQYGFGRIVKTTDGGGPPVGINPPGSEAPLMFSLYQNYPNPFNPTTTLKFDIPIHTHAKLIVYDIQGRETAVLVDDKLDAGSYDKTWDASNYASGIYFFKLEAEEFCSIKKMVLLK